MMSAYNNPVQLAFSEAPNGWKPVMRAPRLISDQTGGVLVESAMVISFTLIFIFGAIDFLFAFYQWNVANKAVQFGARIAAVSNPVDSDLPSYITYTGLSAGQQLPVNSNLYSLTCDGATSTCTCDTGHTCTGMGLTYDSQAMNTIVFGRNWLVTNNASCSTPASNGLYLMGMCQIFPRIGVANVRVTYQDSGLGFAFQPGGPTPTVVVRLQNIPFQFFFLGSLLGFGTRNIPAQATSVSGEDLSVTWPIP
jgi:Flp pilus assembly protein TadG